MKTNSIHGSVIEKHGECPQCGEQDCMLWHMECCDKVMCDGCKVEHDTKYHYSAEPITS